MRFDEREGKFKELEREIKEARIKINENASIIGSDRVQVSRPSGGTPASYAAALGGAKNKLREGGYYGHSSKRKGGRLKPRRK